MGIQAVKGFKKTLDEAVLVVFRRHPRIDLIEVA
jgi:hypothetical protein